MMTRTQSRAKDLQDSSHVPAKGQFRPRPFVSSIPEQQVSIKEVPDRVAQFGHNFREVNLFSIIQPKLKVGLPNDRYEQEADRVAEQVMRMPCPLCKDEAELDGRDIIQRRPADDQTASICPRLESQILSMGTGQPLQKSERDFFESHFGHNFGRVRVHTDERAARMAGAMNAQAFTLGHDVAFGAGQYKPETAYGKRLLAHELTHVIQQQCASPLCAKRSKLLSNSEKSVVRNRLNSPMVREVSRENTVQCAFPWLIAAAVAALAAGGYAWWAHSCLEPMEIPMYVATFGNDWATNRSGGFRRWYFNRTGNPVPSRVWDAFGHCFVACAATQRCGSTTTAIAGQGRELYREYIDAAPHDSYTQDTNNQALGRRFGRQGVNCTEACRNASLQPGVMDLTAPLVSYWTPTRGEYLASAEERRRDAEQLAQERRRREAQQLQERLRSDYQACLREVLERPGGVPTAEEEDEARERCRQRTGYPH